MEKLPDALIVINRIGIIVDMNEEAESLFGFTREDLLGKPIETLIPEEHHEKHREHVKAFFRQPRRREMGRGLKLERSSRDGEKVGVKIELSPLPIGGDDGGIFGLATVRSAED